MEGVDQELFGGIDGGATKSIACIIDIKGNIISTTEGESTHLWLIGVDESAKRIQQMFIKCLKKANLPLITRLKSIGCCVSGSEQEEKCIEFAKSLESACSHIGERFIIKNDTYGPVSTVSQHGCIVLIAGTGSNCQFISQDYNFRCGGWGHLIAERGSAYWIAKRAIKIVFDDEDNYKPVPYSTMLVKEKMFDHFNVKDRYGMLDYYYGKFDKSVIASFCKTMSILARDQHDGLSQYIFSITGKDLASYIIGVLGLMKQNMKSIDSDVKVVCVGSVWKSWDLLKDGFNSTISSHSFTDIKSIVLVKLTKTSAVGAALLGLLLVNEFAPDIDYSKNYEVFHTIKVN